MNKKIITIAIIALLATTAPVFAQQTPTQANAAAGSGNPPTVMAKYEFIKDNPNMDDDSTKPWLQVNPPAGFNQTKTLYYVLISTDSNLQLADLGNSYVDVYHPDGTRKYEVALDTKVSCNDNSGNLEAMITQITAADSKHLITYAPGQTLTTVIAALRQCKAKIYWGQADMNSCQMCGQFTWRHDCVDCGNQWSVDDFCTGYKVDGYTYDASNKNPSPILTNYFEYICSAGLEADFNKLDFGTVTPGGDQWIGGDTIWNSLGVGCNQPGCVPPTIRNTGNIPINISITQDDMGFGQLNTGTWNVYWDARLGEFNEHAVSTFDPYQTTVLDGTVGLCGYSKISFSMHVKKIDPTLFGPHTGHVTLEPNPLDFPWFAGRSCVVGCNYSVVPTGTPYPGLYGSTVTPVTITNTDCSQVTALRSDATQQFGSTGWAGWSCLEGGYPNVIGGGYVPSGANVLNSLAWKPGASVGIYNYPTTPWGYVYAAGETGWIVQAGVNAPLPTGVYVLCGQ